MNKDIQQTNTDAQFPHMNSVHNSPADDEIDLRELFSVIWQGKWLIIAITAVFAIGSVIFALSQPNTYKSQALLAPASEEQSAGLSGLASQFGGLASMAGINLGATGGADKTQMAIEVIKSRQFTSDFIQSHNILLDLMAADKWNMATDTLTYDAEIYDALNNKWVRDVRAPFKPEPSMQEAYKEFSKAMSINLAKNTGMVTISVEHVSPSIAKQWVDWLIEDINKVMKERDVAEAIRSSEFLNKQIALTNVADIRSILYKLIEEQAKTIMFAEVRDEYVFKTIDPAFAPEEKAGPKRALICVLGTMLGGMLAMMIVLIRHFVRKD
ncbi:Wzz/FepE/Etk N-terminal domain-containing protein [Shewanella fidelis]|uniref:Wzz/FepE/Etk N-terminal domain-containing protein n=1 Tax=Shewanella fidelis TaxID=173509 RepID=A0AAW8NRE9_9GAMM|nr:Wzz/FepE/Etk N-terminal domain-containing protein [Shewanella fidelis]MDR8524434.1 Wzz/FepE/Etk N-terminal domain-containing protein [Shewanella fidelis]MDW4811910.1 Wzz/FepE/Etk N-terminal domain-containing protein [Shewanella fidelis]MDW4817151.1 Wzz/FepE/Etk N-terminal domain-containing protein [Shewanella fidelis]MDW4821221.1 Wzz/FepE/Etk N-terminal domain-containing protein [Shewanella fidelis]MDW4822516.1 Wzz/FepE/Etk N-terminal domain-containing protein [Shewanella fidelis]